MIATLLLAAGHGRRFGDDKLVAPLGARPVICWSADTLHGVADAMYVVVPPEAGILRAALAGRAVRYVENARRDEGMGSSIRAGIAALPPDTEAVIIALGDQPLVSRTVAAEVCARWRSTGAPAVVPRYRNGRGHPVLFSRSCFPALAALTGDRGARAVLDALGDAVAFVELDDLMPLDVDTPDALIAVERLLLG